MVSQGVGSSKLSLLWITPKHGKINFFVHNNLLCRYLGTGAFLVARTDLPRRAVARFVVIVEKSDLLFPCVISIRYIFCHPNLLHNYVIPICYIINSYLVIVHVVESFTSA